MKRAIQVIILSIVILTALFSGCGGKEKEQVGSKKEPAPKPTEEVTPPAPVKAQKAVFEGPGKKLVKQAGAWALHGAPRYFGPDNLYDLINGGSDVYTAYGLEKMVTADYRSNAHKDVTITAEIYAMKSALGAFGRFSRFLQSKADPASVGEGLPEAIAGQGLFGGASASFWKGPYLVNLTVLDESATATMESAKSVGAKALPVIAEALFSNISENDPPPEDLSLFPEKSLIARSQVYVPKALMGVKTLGGFSARYKQNGEEWTLFLSSPLSDDAAVTTALKDISENQPDVVAQKEGKRLFGFKATSAPSKKSAAEMLAQIQKKLGK